MTGCAGNRGRGFQIHLMGWWDFTDDGWNTALSVRRMRRTLNVKGWRVVMFQPSISLLVLVGLFASQLASIPHAHGLGTTDQEREHASRPHFHLAGTGHSHDHKHCQHSHSHSKSPQQRPAKSNEPVVADRCTDCDHDVDAVFAPSNLKCVPQVVQTDVAMQSITLLTIALDLADVASARGFQFSRPPPDAVLDASDTYLTLRNLRI